MNQLVLATLRLLASLRGVVGCCSVADAAVYGWVVMWRAWALLSRSARRRPCTTQLILATVKHHGARRVKLSVTNWLHQPQSADLYGLPWCLTNNKENLCVLKKLRIIFSHSMFCVCISGDDSIFISWMTHETCANIWQRFVTTVIMAWKFEYWQV